MKNRIATVWRMLDLNRLQAVDLRAGFPLHPP